MTIQQIEKKLSDLIEKYNLSEEVTTSIKQKLLDIENEGQKQNLSEEQTTKNKLIYTQDLEEGFEKIRRKHQSNKNNFANSAFEIINREEPEFEPLIPGFINRKSINAIAADPGSFKSFFLLIILLIGACGGGEVLGLKIKPLRVLIIDEENRYQRIKERLKKIANGYKLNVQNSEINFIIDKGFKFDIPLGLDRESVHEKLHRDLEVFLANHKVDVIVLDSLVRFMSKDENSVRDVRSIFDRLKELSNKYDCSFILIHHTRKGYGKKGAADLRGSSDLHACLDSLFMLNKEGPSEYELSCAKFRDSNPIKNIRFEVIDTVDEQNLPGIYLKDLSSDIDCQWLPKASDTAKEDILATLRSKGITQFNTGEITNDLAKNHKKSQVQIALNELVKNGFLCKMHKGRWEVIDKQKEP